MRTGVETGELQVAARSHASAADSTNALATALSAQAAATSAWSSGVLAGAAERFFTTLAWAATSGAGELSGLASRLQASADGYDLAELIAATRFGLDTTALHDGGVR
ncbi:hypothetical protein [Kineococcus glutinatus]|uniref:Excreted virulence factor EspC (Type VII ESX diderm) n=1 Tax=Kineococcus glutinatus TaxID=1070872 RepID=A0ABP9HBD4_9ACTN